MSELSTKRIYGIESIYNAMFFMGYLLWIISSHIYLSGFKALWGDNVYSYITESAVVFLCIALVLSALINPLIRHPRVILLFGLSIVLAAVAQSKSGGIASIDELNIRSIFVENKIVDIVILLFAANKIDFRRICKWGAIFSLLCLMIVVVSSHAGLIINGVRPNDDRNRYYLGYTYPTHGAIFFVNISFSIIYYIHEMRRKHTMLLLIILLGINTILYILTDTRLPFLIVTIMVFSYVVVDILNVKYMIPASCLGVIAVAVYPICAMFSFVLGVLYNGNSRVFLFADRLLSGRLYLNNIAFSRYTPAIWGQQVVFNSDPNNFFYIDNGYVYVLLLYGVALFVGIMVYYSVLCLLASKRNNYMILWWLILYAGYNIIQHNLLGVVQTAYLSIWLLLENHDEGESIL